MLQTPGPMPRDTLLQARRIYFQFSLFDLMRKKYSVRRAEVVDGFLHLTVFQDGSNNYTFWKQTGGSETGTDDIRFDLRRVLFTNVGFIYNHQRNHHKLDFYIHQAIVSGKFSLDDYLLAIKGDMTVNNLVADKVLFAENKHLTFDLLLHAANNQVFTFREGAFSLGNHSFAADGVIDLSGQHTYLDLKIAAKDLRLDNFIADLPPQYTKYFDGFRSKGTFYFNASISGSLNPAINPYIEADFGLKMGEITQRKNRVKFEDLSFDASFNNGANRNIRSSTLVVKNLQARLNNKELKADGTIVNFFEPAIEAKIFSNISANDWQKFLQWEQLTSASGDLLVNIDFKGRMGENRKFTVYHFMASRVAGEIKAIDLSFRLKNDPLIYNSINADFRFNNNDIHIKRFDGKASSSDFDMKGYFRNVMPWLFFDDQRLFVNATLSSGNLNFNELLQHNVSGNDTIYHLRLSEMIDFRLQANIGKLAFRKFDAQNVKGVLSMRQQMFYASDISLASMKGNIIASGYINGKDENNLVIGCEARFVNVDVYDLFYQMGNFGQQSIEYDNLRGRITANASFISNWSPWLIIDWNSLEVTADIRIENGELINYKPMLALSRFIRVGDLNQVKFSTLENQIRIKNQKIIIPDMEVNSNAINIKLSGEHTFNNNIDYRVQIFLSDLLARRHRESRNPQEQYGDIIDDRQGRTTLFLKITGTIDEPVFRYDTRAVREKIRDDLRQERQNLRQIFRQEFGLNRKDTLPDGTPVQPNQREVEKQEIRNRERGKFIIEWDDD